MKKKVKMKFPTQATLHVPSWSGIALNRSGAHLADKLDAFTCPFLAVESKGRFAGYRWQPWSRLFSRPAISLDRDHWMVEWGEGTELIPLGETRSLRELAARYRKDCPLTPIPGAEVLGRVKRIVFLDMWQADGRIAHTYDNVMRLMKDLTARRLAEGTLFYLPGWFAPYDANYPQYEPADELGGKSAFRKMVALGKREGMIVMPHLNFWGYDPRLDPLIDRSVVQMHDRSGNVAHWPKFTPACMGNEICYMRISHSDWQKLFFRYFDSLVGDYGLEAVFLDQIGNVLDDAVCDFQAATTALLERMHATFPELLIAGEVLSEAIVDHVSLVQSTWVTVVRSEWTWSPVVKHLYAGRLKFFPHLFLAAATPCRYVLTIYPWCVEQGIDAAFRGYQRFNQALGGIPSVRLDYNRFGIDARSLAVLRDAP